MALTQTLIQQALAPVAEGLSAVATNTGVSLGGLLDTVPPSEPPVNERISTAVNNALSTVTDVPDYLSVAASRPGMRNDNLFRRLNLLDPRMVANEQELAGQKAVNEAQENLLRELAARLASQDTATAEQDARLEEMSARLDLVKLDVQNARLDLAANQAHDAERDTRLSAVETLATAGALAVAALQQQQASTVAALAANTAADLLNAAQLAATQATAAQALALGQAEHTTNVAQQSQIDANSAQDALDRARQTADEAAIAAAQDTATRALQKANEDATAAAQALSAAQAAQTTATQAGQAAATAQATATAASAAATAAQTSATTAKAAADAAQAKADADATAAANAQATANAAQQAAATNATSLTALQNTVAGKLDATLLRRGSVTTPAVTIVVATPAAVQVAFTPAFADANYEVLLSKPAGGLLGVELGWQNKTAQGFSLTLRNTGAVSLAIAASTVDYFAIHN